MAGNAFALERCPVSRRRAGAELVVELVPEFLWARAEEAFMVAAVSATFLAGLLDLNSSPGMPWTHYSSVAGVVCQFYYKA